jgi:hypothetical protein
MANSQIKSPASPVSTPTSSPTGSTTNNGQPGTLYEKRTPSPRQVPYVTYVNPKGSK